MQDLHGGTRGVGSRGDFTLAWDEHVSVGGIGRIDPVRVPDRRVIVGHRRRQSPRVDIAPGPGARLAQQIEGRPSGKVVAPRIGEIDPTYARDRGRPGQRRRLGRAIHDQNLRVGISESAVLDNTFDGSTGTGRDRCAQGDDHVIQTDPGFPGAQRRVPGNEVHSRDAKGGSGQHRALLPVRGGAIFPA